MADAMDAFNLPKRTGTGLSVADSERPKRVRYDENGGGGPANTKRLKPEDYTIGWICALPIERTAAEAMLDEEHFPLANQSAQDDNAYTLGRIGEHNVVIAGLPNDDHGLNNAIMVANNMKWSFPSINRRLIVGIGGGAPDLADIRLGDVVISSKVIQYDFGKSISNDQFQKTAIPIRPPKGLLNAVAKLRALHNRLPSRIPEIIDNTLKRYPKMVSYRRPTGHDVLYDSSYDHVPSSRGTCDSCDRQHIKPRTNRPNTNPVIHYGTVASANQVMRNGTLRKRTTEELQVACFEMEAAGLMDDTIGCLVIRGICDYSDSHKNKEWQEHAAAVAAAYATELLPMLPTTAPRDGPLSNDATDDVAPTGQARTDAGKFEEQRRQLIDSLNFDELESRHTNIKAALRKTCDWFLTDDYYLDWLNPDYYSKHHGFLWISGKPGSGKSTLMKFIYSNMNKMEKEEPQTAVVAFFFNARGTELEKSTPGLYRSLIFQILTKFPALGELLNEYQVRSIGQISWDLDILQNLFQDIIGALGSRKLICFIDALDECDEEQVRALIELLEELGETAVINGTRFYLCLSSRHYPHVEIQPCLRRTLEDQPGHEQDIQKYIAARFRPGSSKSKVSTKISSMLLEKAGGVFLWVVLVIDILNKELQDGKVATIERHVKSLPSGLMELFQRIILRDDTNQERLLLCIQWVLYAKRPLNIEEFYYALHSGLYPGPDVLSPHDPESITREDMDRFVLSSSKGLAEVTKTKKAEIQFIHESVRDFLLKENGLQYLLSNREGDFEARSHDELKKCCQFYILVDLSPYAKFYDERASESKTELGEMRQMILRQFPFLAYATACMFHHSDTAQRFIPQDGFLDELDYHQWLRCDRTLEQYEVRRHSFVVNLVYLFAEQGWVRLLNLALGRTPMLAECQKDRCVHPLIAASLNGHQEAVKLLLEKGADVNASGGEYRNAFSAAFRKGHQEIMLLLLSWGAEVDVSRTNKNGESPLVWAIMNGHEAIIKPLVDKGVGVAETSRGGYTALSVAVKRGNEALVKMLIDNGAEVDSTALKSAAENGYEAIVKLLIDNGAEVDSMALILAAGNGHEVIVKLLIDNGAEVDFMALMWAAEKGHEAIVKVLIGEGANLEARNHTGQTLLSLAASNGHEGIAKLLIEKGADVNTKDQYGRTPLLNGFRHESIVKLLVDKDADVNIS